MSSDSFIVTCSPS